MCTLDEIESKLKSSTDDLKLQIVRSLGSSTVALFAVFDDHGKDLLELAGSGSLVFVQNVLLHLNCCTCLGRGFEISSEIGNYTY